ncbi:MAG: NusG domain II-containing protein, partial [Synergistaceae bacterium]|jgi:hypothetical protein|nr:NusG domain II-containing protein [Synergistaceae bacterium]
MISEPKQRKFFVFRDAVFLSLSVLALTFFVYGARERMPEGNFAEITVDGQIVKTVSLGEEEIYTPPGRPGVEIAVRGGMIGFVRSDCPDKICVHSGFLSVPGQSAVCLPNRVVARVAPRKEEGIDSTVY